MNALAIQQRRSLGAGDIGISVGIHLLIFLSFMFSIDSLFPSKPVRPMLAIEAVVIDTNIEQAPVLPEPQPQPDEQALEAQRQLEAAEAERQREQELAEQQAAEERRQQEQRAAEERRQAEQREAEERQRREQQAAEERRQAEERAAEERRQAEQRAREEALRAEQQRREAELAAAMAAEEAEMAAVAAGERERWAALVIDKVRRNWSPPGNFVAGVECTVAVQIDRFGGEVISARVENCSDNKPLQRSIEYAVNAASPLPLPANPAVFDQNLRFIFKPQQ